MENQKADLNKLAKSWKSPFVARGSIREFSGGLIHPRTLANMDSKGIGPDGKFRMGRQVGYPVEAVNYKWRRNSEACSGRKVQILIDK